jgi:hypothetical protein
LHFRTKKTTLILTVFFVAEIPCIIAHQMREAIGPRDTESERVREVARTFNVSHSTIRGFLDDDTHFPTFL